MKIIHCADIHLDSPFNSNLPYDKSKQMRSELVLAFLKMVDYAVDNDIGVVIIAGDFFDSLDYSAATERLVIDKIRSVANIDFLYLKGNHDNGLVFKTELPSNFKIMKSGEAFEYEEVYIKGFDLSDGQNYNDIDFDENKFNIAVAHGTVSSSTGEDLVKLSEFKNKNIDYLALGHIHRRIIEPLDNRGIYAYCGCFFGRGFDECGEKGFLVLDTNTKKIDFIKGSERTFEEVQVDITGVSAIQEVIDRISNAVVLINENSIVRVVLSGKYNEELIKNTDFLQSFFEESFFLILVKDNSTRFISYDNYRNDISLKGEFLRLVDKEELSANEKERVISVVMNALNSEELGI